MCQVPCQNVSMVSSNPYFKPMRQDLLKSLDKETEANMGYLGLLEEITEIIHIIIDIYIVTSVYKGLPRWCWW